MPEFIILFHKIRISAGFYNNNPLCRIHINPISKFFQVIKKASAVIPEPLPKIVSLFNYYSRCLFHCRLFLLRLQI